MTKPKTTFYNSRTPTTIVMSSFLSFILIISCIEHCHGARGNFVQDTTKSDDYKSFLSRYIYDKNEHITNAEQWKDEHGVMLEEFVQGMVSSFPTRNHLAVFVRSVASDKKSGIGLKCSVQMLEMYEGVINFQKWALEMIDSWGKPGPGLLHLYSIFRGDYKECINVRAHPPWKPRPTTTTTVPQYDYNYNHTDIDQEQHLEATKQDKGDDKEQLHDISSGGLFPRNGTSEEKPMSILERVWAVLNAEQREDSSKVLFKGKYCKVGIGLPKMPIDFIQVPILKIYIGLAWDVCLPDSCNAEDANILVQKTIEKITFKSNYSIFAPQKSQCQEETKIESKTIGVICFVIVGVLWLTFTTSYDVIMVQRPRWNLQALKVEFKAKRAALLEATEAPPAPPVTVLTNGHSHTNGHTDSSHLDNGHVINNDDHSWLITRDGALHTIGNNIEEGNGDAKRPLEDILFEPPPLTKTEKYLSFFSVYTNGTKILNTNLAEGTLTTLHGIRFLSMCWIILGHTLLVGMINVENVVDFMWEMKTDTMFLILANGFLCVDTFFVMSGMMVGYYFQGIVDHETNYKWVVYIIHRFVRLSPALAVACSFYIGMWPILGSGPNYPAKAPDEDMCRETWMYTLFYINNFLPMDKLCMMWTWYLSCDYQFYLICPIFMTPLCKGYKKTGIAIGVLFIVGTMIASGIISYNNQMAEILPQMFTPEGLSRPQDYYNLFYQRPYCRMGPYVIGLFLGYILYTTDRKVHMPKWVIALGWITSTAVAMATLFGVHDSFAGYNIMSAMESALYNAFKHTVFGLCIAWVLFACLTGYGGFIQTILSFKAFIPLSRLTYCTYLVHPCIVYLFCYSQNGIFWLNSWNLAFNYMGILFCSIVTGAVVSVFVESPTIRIEREILIQLDLIPPSVNF